MQKTRHFIDPMNLFKELKGEHIRLSAKIASLERAISKLPEGSLKVKRRGNTHRFYHCQDKSERFISKKETDLLEALAKKKYYQKMLQDARKEKNAIGKYLCSHSEDNLADQLLAKNPQIDQILRPLFKPMDEAHVAEPKVEVKETREEIKPSFDFDKVIEPKKEIKLESISEVKATPEVKEEPKTVEEHNKNYVSDDQFFDDFFSDDE